MLQDRAQEAQLALEEDKQALILYCQQFAFSPEMVEPCEDILICNESEVDFKYPFPGDFEPYMYDSEAHFQHLLREIESGTFEYPRSTLNEMPPEHSQTGMFQWMEYEEPNGTYDEHLEDVNYNMVDGSS